MRTEKQIKADLLAAKAQWHEQSANADEATRASMSANIKALTEKLALHATEGANPCPVCGVRPHGIHQPRYWEIGCLTDPVRARGETREEAVENWNAGQYLPVTVSG